MHIKFYVDGQNLIRTNEAITASGSKNYLTADFRFSAQWCNLVKTAVFESADKSARYHVLLDGGSCTVPPEVISTEGFWVSVFAGNRITSTRVFVNVAESGIVPGLTPPEPTADVYDNIVERLGKLSEDIANIDTSVPDDYITSSMLKSSSVTTPKLAANSVTSSKLADDAVTSQKLASGAVTSSKLAQKAVGEDALSDKVRLRLAKADELEKRVFYMSSTPIHFACVLSKEIPPVELVDSQRYNNEYACVDIAKANPRFLINGIEYCGLEMNPYHVLIPLDGEEAYIKCMFSTEEETISYNYSSSYIPPFYNEKTKLWNFTLYKYDDIQLNFTSSSESPTGDLFDIESYSCEYAQENADASDITYTVKHEHLTSGSMGSLADLKTADKSSVICAVNENTQSIHALEKTVGDANGILEKLISEGV